MIEQSLFCAIAFTIMIRAVRVSVRGRAQTVVVSLVASVIYIICLWVPSRLQSSGLVESKLVRAGLAPSPTSGEIDELALRWSVELLLVVLVEAFVVFSISRKFSHKLDSPRELMSDKLLQSRVAYIQSLSIFLISVGLIATILLPAPSLEDRAAGGQGIPTLLRTFLICGLGLLCYYDFFRKRFFALCAACGLIFLILSSVRSPILVLFVAYFAGLISRNSLTYRKFTIIGISGVLFALVGALMSNVRANEIRNYGLSLSEIFSDTMSAPWTAVYEAGVDTLDGYRLAILIDGRVSAQPFDFLTVFTNFVPRSIWPDKPTDFTVAVSSEYLNYGASGQFLSPVGYLTLAYGGYAACLLALTVVVAFFVLLSTRYYSSFWLAIIICMVFRFFLGGSAFDVYYSLTLVVCVLSGQAAISFIAREYFPIHLRSRKTKATDRFALSSSPFDYAKAH